MENERFQPKVKIIWILIFTILGLLVTIDLAKIYYDANFNQYALSSFCSVSEFIDCDGVARTTESQFLGVPLAYWGIFLYLFILLMLVVDKLKNIPFLKFLEVFKNKFHYIASLGIISFSISMILLCVSFFEIKKLCYMCAITYIINLCIAIIAVKGIDGGFIGAIKQSCSDFIQALKPIPYRIAFAVVMIFAFCFLGWTFKSAVFSPALKHQRNYGEFINSKTNKYAVKGNLLGSKAKDAIVIEVYSDYMCPMCTVFNMMIHKIAKDFSNVRIEHHSLPLDIECNKYLERPFHQGSCIAAKYAEAAHKQGKFWEVNTLLFDNKPDSEEAIIELLSTSGFGLDMDRLQQDAHSKEVEKIIQKDIDTAAKHNMIGTPAMKIGNDFEMGIPKNGYRGLKLWVKQSGGKLRTFPF